MVKNLPDNAGHMVLIPGLGRSLGFPGGLDSKESACSAGDLGSIPGSGRSLSLGKGNGYPFQCFLHGESHEQKSLVGYSPWGHKELDMTEQLSRYRRNQSK